MNGCSSDKSFVSFDFLSIVHFDIEVFFPNCLSYNVAQLLPEFPFLLGVLDSDSLSQFKSSDVSLVLSAFLHSLSWPLLAPNQMLNGL